MYYFLIGGDGKRYGPADVDTLVQWVHEGRIVTSTILIERGTDREVRADSVTGVAAALRRQSGTEAEVTIERDEATPGEVPTMTRGPKPECCGPAASPVENKACCGPASRPVARQAGPEGMLYDGPRALSSKSKIVAGLLGIFLGGLGIHRFYLGYTGIGLVMLLLSVVGGLGSIACVPGLGCGLVGIWGLIEGIVCLCGGMRDANGLELRD